MSSSRIKVKFLNGICPDEFELMGHFKSTVDIDIVDIFTTNNAAIITLASHSQIDSLLQPEIIMKFANLNLEIIPSPMHKSERTIFVAKVRHFITNSSPETLIRKINSNNSNSLQAIEVNIITSVNHKEGMRKNLKVTFSNVNQAAKARADGFYIGDLMINPESIYKEDFVEIKQCFRCFQYNHFTNQCKAPQALCSICSGKHSFKNCRNKNNLRCSNCEGDHVSISASCPVRKNVVKKLKELRHSNDVESVHNESNQIKNKVTPDISVNNNVPDQFPSLPASKPINTPWAKSFYNPKLHKKKASQQTPLLNNPPPNPSQPCPPFPPPPPPPVNPSHPSPSPLPINPNQSSILPALVEVWKSIASRVAGSDNALYIKILNGYFIENGFPGFKTPQFVQDIVDNNSSKTPPPPIPQPPPSTNPTPTPSPEILSPNDVGNDVIEQINSDTDDTNDVNDDDDSSIESSEDGTVESDNESTTVKPSNIKFNLQKFSPMTLRSHHKIKNRTVKEVGPRCRSRDQSPELFELPPNPRIRHYNSTASLYHKKRNKNRNRHDQKVLLSPYWDTAFKAVKQKIIEYKKEESVNSSIQ